MKSQRSRIGSRVWVLPLVIMGVALAAAVALFALASAGTSSTSANPVTDCDTTLASDAHSGMECIHVDDETGCESDEWILISQGEDTEECRQISYPAAPELCLVELLSNDHSEGDSVVEVGACPTPTPTPTPTPPPSVDLVENPSYVLQQEFDRTLVELDGVRLGDPEDNIPKGKVYETNEAGWYFCDGGARYRVANGRIVELGLGDELLRRTGLLREDEIEMRLGKADKVDTLDVGGIPLLKTYQFFDRHIYVRVTSDGEVMVITILE